MIKILILILFIFQFYSSSAQISRAESINRGLKDVQKLLPYNFNNGIIWTEAINENNISRVYIYKVSNEALDLVNSFSKNQMLNQSKKLNAYKIARDMKINCIWRYYNNNRLIKEIIIYPQDW